MRDPIGCAGQSDRVVRPPPTRAGQRETRRDRLVDVGVIDLLHGALRNAGASKDAKISGELLFEIESDTVLGAKATDGTGRRGLTRGLAQRDRVEIGSEIAAGEPIEAFELAGLIPKRMPLFQLGHELPLAEAVG